MEANDAPSPPIVFITQPQCTAEAPFKYLNAPDDMLIKYAKLISLSTDTFSSGKAPFLNNDNINITQSSE